MTLSPGKNVWWLYQGRRVATNTNAAGNPIIIDVSVATGQVARLVAGFLESASVGTHGLQVYVVDEDNATFAILGRNTTAATSVLMEIPSIGTAASATININHSLGWILGPAQKLSFQANANSGQANDTLTVAVVLLLSTPIEPTWDKSRSGNAADTTLGTDSISDANDLQAVVM